jgi:hypothetical protein
MCAVPLRQFGKADVEVSALGLGGHLAENLCCRE